jgi:ribosomal protein L30/L7E
VNLTAKQVEPLFDVLEDIDHKLEALGIVEINDCSMLVDRALGAGKVANPQKWMYNIVKLWKS